MKKEKLYEANLIRYELREKKYMLTPRDKIRIDEIIKLGEKNNDATSIH